MVAPPPEAVTVTVAEPRVAVVAALSVSVVVPVPGAAIDPGVSVPVTPFGNPAIENRIAAANPLEPAVETVIGIDPPRATATVVPLRVMAKLGPMTVSVREVVCEIPPPEAVIVSA